MDKEISLEQLLKEHKISQRTYDKVTVAKQYIERKYNLKTAKNLEWNEIINKIDSLKICDKEKQKIKKEIYKQEMIKSRKSREKQTIHDYESIAIIGRGAFGEVHVCREKKTDKIYAIKKIKKNILILKNQIIHILNEQIFMSRANSPWIVELKASFQEDDYLYLVMEYLPGGDLMNLLIKKDILSEDEAKFYISELILAIESIHKLDCIHRDIKPDNVLIDKDGHIKLSDFGLAKISDKLYEKENEKYKNYISNKNNNNNNEEKMTHNKNYSCVGTAYYVAPEVLNKKGYDKEIDWWSVGIIFYEMLVGYAPFCSKETTEVCYKVLNWKKYLKIPSKIKISEQAQDLIFKMINKSDNRLGKNGAEEIKKHPFFNGVDWDNIRNTKAPFIPILKNEYDTSYFETFEIKEPFYPKTNNKLKRKDIEYLGYTFKEGLYNANDLKQEFEEALKTIDIELKTENPNRNHNNRLNNDIGQGNENIDLNIKKKNNNINNNLNNTVYSNYMSKVIKRKVKPIKDLVIKKDLSQIPFRKASTSRLGGKIQNTTSAKAIKILNKNYYKYKDLSFKIGECSVPISSNNKHKLNIIQLPLKKTKPNIYFSNKVLNIINDSNSISNTNNTIDDNYNTTRNNTYRSVKPNNYIINKPNNSFLINNKMKKYLKNISFNNSRIGKMNKLNIAPINKNNKKFSPQPKCNVFIKKNIIKNKLSKDKFCLVNNSYRNNSIESYRTKPIVLKSCSSNFMKKPLTINTSRGNSKNNYLNIYTPISVNNQSYNSLNNSKQAIQQGYKKAIVYNNKK